MPTLAFHSDPALKAKYLARVAAHEAADEIIHGTYWEHGKGCAVGCTVHASNHVAFETELGIPCVLAYLEDHLFEGQNNGDSKTFPRRFLEAITPGADLSRVVWQFLHWLLTEEIAARDDPRITQEIKACADVLIPLTKGESVDKRAAQLACQAARKVRHELQLRRDDAPAAAVYAPTAVDYTATAAAVAAAYAAAAAAAYASDYDAAFVAEAHAAAAATAAYAAAAAAYASAIARSLCFGRMAAKLIELLREAPALAAVGRP